MDIEKEVKQIKRRNARVELDKAYGIGGIRKIWEKHKK